MSTTTLNPIARKPISSKIAGLTLSFKPTIKRFGLHNATRKPKSPMYASNKITIPACNEIGPYPVLDADGHPIPGSRLVSDIYTFQEHLGAETLTMDAEKAIIHILGIKLDTAGEASQLTSSFAVSGISYLPLGLPKEVWKEIVADGEHRAFWAACAAAEYTIAAIDQANAIRKQRGDLPVPGGYEYEQAKNLLIERDRILRNEGEHRAYVPGPVQEEAELANAAEEAAERAEIRAIVMKLAEKAAEKQAVDKTKLFDELLDDPAVYAYAQKERQMRIKGHRPVKVEDLQAAVEMGISMTEAGLKQETLVEKVRRAQQAEIEDGDADERNE